MVNKMERLPVELTPINIRAYFHNAFGACGCSEIGEMVISIKTLLEWCGEKGTRVRYSELYPDLGIFYLMVGLLDSLGLIEHGTAIRYPWVTREGKRFLEALNITSVSEIEDASGEAYDGLWWGEIK